jgi:3-methyladenine DNA glycosylase AlkD
VKQEELKGRLATLSEPSYAKFLDKLKCSRHLVLGIRTPKLTTLAKELAKTEGISFLDDFFLYEQVSYEEIVLSYKVMGLLRLDRDTTQIYVNHLLSYNDGWATNDTLCSALTAIGRQRADYWPWIQDYLQSPNPWDIRFATISMMNWYLTDEYAQRSLQLLSTVRNDFYYVTMGLGWFYATAFAKQREKTLPYLFEGVLPPAVQKKAIQKCIESFRVSGEDKLLLRSIRIEGVKR